MKPRHAAQRLGLSTRQVRRLVQRHEAQGAAGLVSQKRNRPSFDNARSGFFNMSKYWIGLLCADGDLVEKQACIFTVPCVRHSIAAPARDE